MECLEAQRRKASDEKNISAQLDAARTAARKIPPYTHSKFCLYYDDDVCRCGAGAHNLALAELLRALGLEVGK